jgi:S-adenosyl-L-methionine hydrolase (adenosine-forming)
VVDPGVGTERRPIAARLGDQVFVGPDNGVLTQMLLRADKEAQPLEIVHAENPQFWLPQVSSIFHGRDVFAALAGHLAAGVSLSRLGTPILNPILLDFPSPQPYAGGWLGQVMDIDHFGNLEVNIHRTQLEGLGPVEITCGAHTIHGIVRTFGEAQPGDLVALIDSSDYLSLSIVNGSAASVIPAQTGDAVIVRPTGETS